MSTPAANPLPLPEPTYATTPTVGYWQSRLAAALGAAKPEQIEMARQEWTARAEDLRAVKDALMTAIPLVQQGMNADSGVGTMRSMFAVANKAERRAESMDQAALALGRVRAAVEEAGKVLTPLQGTEIYEPVKGPPPVNGWDSPRGLKVAARFAEEQKKFQTKVLEREEAARLALTELDRQYRDASVVFEQTHQTGEKAPGETKPVPGQEVDHGIVPVVPVRLTTQLSPKAPVEGDLLPVPVPGEPTPGFDAPVTGTTTELPPWLARGAEFAPISFKEVQASSAVENGGMLVNQSSDLPSGVRGSIPHVNVGGSGPVDGGGAMLGLGGFIGAGAFLGALGSITPPKPAPATPLADEAATGKQATASTSNANSNTSGVRGMGGAGMGMGAGAGAAGGRGAGGRGRARGAFANAVKVTKDRKGKDRRNAFEREEDRDPWI